MRKVLSITVSILIVVESIPMGILPFQQKPPAVEAAALSKTSQAEWMAGKYEFNEIDIATSSGDMKLQFDLGSWNASGSADLNHYAYIQEPMVKVGRFVYMLRNRNVGQLYRYDLDSREWKEMANLPNSLYEVADMTTNGTDSIYAFATRYSAGPPSMYYKHFLKYDIPTDTWSYLDDPPADLRSMAALEYVSGSTNYIYAIEGAGRYGFWKYNVSTNTWSIINNTTYYCQSYCDLEYDGSRYIYGVTDWYAPDRIYRFDTQVGTWAFMASAPLDGSISTGVKLAIFGNYVYTLRGVSTRTFYRYSISGNTWSTAADVPYAYYGSLISVPEDNKIIVYASPTNFFDYYPATNSWSDPLRAVTYGADAGQQTVSDGAGNIYYCIGAGSTACYKYTIATDTWVALTAAPATIGSGSSVAWDGTNLYAHRGNYANTFYQFNGSTWAAKTSPPATLTVGSSMVASGSASLFAIQGGGGTGFYRYDIAGNSWTSKTALTEGAYRGSGMIKAGNYIYVLTGYNKGVLLRYNETENSWTRMKSLPVGSYYGGGITYDGVDTIYAFVGGDTDIYSRQFYKYLISEDKWYRVADTPEKVNSGGALVWANNAVYALQGNYSYTMWKYTPSTTLYKTSGSWYSPVYDLTYNSAFGSFTTTQTTPSGTSITYYSRTSDNSNKWDAWTEITGGTISSTARRYLQIKATLASDGTATPTLSDFTVNYTGDTTAPVMTSLSVSGYSASGGSALTSGQTYSHTNPYFTWSGVTDAASGVDGYYVYFGSSATADPETDGNYQTTTNYTVATAMATGSTYYLRIKAKDVVGNVSSAATGFTYGYNGISPPSTQTISTQGNFEAGTLENTTASTSAWWNTSFLYRQQITVTNSSGATAKKGDFAKILSLDTATLIATSPAKLQSDGDDLRVVYWNSTDWVEAKRGWENLDTSSTTVYFDLQANINNGSSDNNYYLYYGNSTATGPTAMPVFNDNFDDNSLNSTLWQVNTNYGTIAETNQRLQYTGRTSGQNGISSQARSKTAITGDFTYETSIYTVNNNGSGFNGAVFLGSYDDSTPNNAAGVLITQNYNGGIFYVYSKAAGAGYTYLTLTATTTEDAWHTLKVKRYGDSWSFFWDGTAIGSYEGLYSGDVYMSTLRYWKESLPTNWQGDQYYDDVYFNSKVASNLTTSAGEETAVTTTTAATLKLTHEKTGTWAGYQLPTLPRALRMYLGSSVYAGNALYVVRGYATQTFYKLDLATSTWTALANTPATMGTTGAAGIAMVFDGTDNIYVTRGGATTAFYKYTISTNTWSTGLAQPELTITSGAAMTMVGTDSIYLLRGGSNMEFLQYTISTNTWSNMTSAPWGPSTGTGMVYDGTNTIYVMWGSSTAFARYTVSTNSWSTDLPLAPYPNGASANDLIYDGNGNLYFFTYYNYQLSVDERHYIWKYNISSRKWSSIDVSTDLALVYGGIGFDGSRYVYLIQGYPITTEAGTRAIYRFDLTTNKFLPETPPLQIDRNFVNSDGEYYYYMPYTGTSLAYDNNDNVYYIQGGAYSYTNKYQISTKKWSMIEPIPCIYYSGGLAWAGNYLYAACGGTTKYFFRYNPVSRYWEQRADTPDTIVASGQGLVYDGSDSMYLLRGNGGTILYKYTISTDAWTTESSTIPGTIGNSYGASITYDGSGALYIIRGNSLGGFYKYNIGTQTWSTLSSAPGRVYNGAGAIYFEGKIYATFANLTQKFYVYDVASDTWEVGPTALSEISIGASLVKGSGSTAYALAGNYDFVFWKFNLPTSTTSYKYNGKFTSAAYDLGTPYGYIGLSATVASPSATTTTFETRTSTDSATWGSWTAATNLKKIAGSTYTYNIASSVNRYIQVRCTLDSDESYQTPSVSNITISYYGDPTVPTNPDTLNSYTTATQAASLTTNTWYNYASPYFAWSGGSDATGSGILGYYVYFGNDENADASVSGTLQTAANYTASFSTDGEYFLKIKTKDNAGNIADHWSPFHYRYDGTTPNTPSSVAADPRSYTATNSFTMFWTTTTDVTSNSTSSGVLGYYYKTGAGTGSFSNDQLTTSTQISSITSYQNGTNTFYVKSKDNAGNYSDYATTAYYYNGSAPSAPTNLAVTPSSNTSNSFAFSWDPPTSYSGSISEYRYSINSLPSATNYTSTNTEALTAGAYATIKGTNVFYVVAVDEAGNVNYDAYASVEFTADTSAPGIPRNVEAFDNSIRSTTSYKVGLTWDAPTDLGTGFAGYAVYGSSTATSCDSSFSSFTLAGTTAGTTYVVASLGGTALSSTTYYFCVKAYDSTNQYSGVSSTVSLLPSGRWLTAPDLSSNPAVTAKTKSASVTWSTSRTANSFVKYGTSSGSYGNEVGSSTQVTAHSVALTNLNPGTTYYYKVLFTDEDGNLGQSSEYSFKTLDAPLVSNVKCTDRGLYSMYITFTVKNASKVDLQYGKTTSYGGAQSLSVSTAESTNSIKLDSLTDGMLYHYRLVAEDEEGYDYNSDDYSCETLPEPKITSLKIQYVMGMPTATVRILWISNTAVTSIITYYPTDNPQSSKDQISIALKTSHDMLLKDLKDNTDYTVIVKGKDPAGNEASFAPQKLKTSADLRAPEIVNMNVESTIVGVGDEAKAQIIVCWDSDEPTSTQVEFGEGTGSTYSSMTQEDTNLTLNHCVTIPSLLPSKIYHLRALSKDKSGNPGISEDTVLVTPKATKDALNLVVDRLSKTFGFIKKIKLFNNGK
ncbi:hypothetical protein A3C23_05065 [Candidatus Roizmanbacteria bacterium RIFCSPHIGHO2_02_FULL_37_13b]|nr:MAG: hypothetical protein A3C23_05065 [Candidatus Roizmanbacteria bacterium RIFCSPHIGHO2_02_FULL_37_13b]